MQFIKNGPDIPEYLLQQHEEGKVVFFCGAGISYPAGLPGFGRLVEKMYEGLGETRNAVEEAAFSSGLYDTTIGLLESRIVGGREAARVELAKALEPDFSKPKATATHEALLTLSQTRKGAYRLITTNFDRLFEEVISASKARVRRYEAPLLPVPKNKWDGIVYIHGLLDEMPSAHNFDCLVASSGDFGLAYLTERWAARFVSELFRNYTVCFVGYSLNDPVLRYMMDALAADRLLGETPPEAFAFGNYAKGKLEATVEDWKSKNVTPILYPNFKNHYYLHETLRVWSETYRDGARGKESIVAEYAIAKPMVSTRQDNFVKRLLWALSDTSGLPAKHFAEHEPLPSIEWLDPFCEHFFRWSDLGRFGVETGSNTPDKDLTFSLLSRPTPYNLGTYMSPVAGMFRNTSQWDQVMFQLARWMVRHLDKPSLLLWVGKSGGKLHPEFRRLILRELPNPKIPKAMKTLWYLATNNQISQRVSDESLYNWIERFKSDGLTDELRFQLRKLLQPKVNIRAPFKWREEEELEEEQSDNIKKYIDWEIVLAGDHVHTSMRTLRDNPAWQENLSSLLDDATSLLLHAMELLRALDGAKFYDDISYIHMPSIAPSDQDNDHNDWTFLIVLARDSWLATARVDPQSAVREVHRWLSKPFPIFRRLAFFAATKTDLIPTIESLEWLLQENGKWLWLSVLQYEAFQLLKKLAVSLQATDKEKLMAAVLNGPMRELYRTDLSELEFARIRDREIWLALAVMKQEADDLGQDAENAFAQLSEQYPEWSLSPDGKDEFAFWVGSVEYEEDAFQQLTPSINLFSWLLENSELERAEGWSRICRDEPEKTAHAIMDAQQAGIDVTNRWRDALLGWSETDAALKSWPLVKAALQDLNPAQKKALSSSLAQWLTVVSKALSAEMRDFVSLAVLVLEAERDEEIEDANEPIFKAINHPVGRTTEAVVRCWYKTGLEDNQKLSGEVADFFELVCDPDVIIFRHGRLILGANAIALFRVDPEWTERVLLPFFDWQERPNEAIYVWHGFLWAGRIYAPLLRLLKKPFLEIPLHYQSLNEVAGSYISLLTFVALEPQDIFSNSELASAMRMLPAETLDTAISAARNRLSGVGDQREEYWKNRVLPFVKKIWPKSQETRTESVSEAFALLTLETGDSFPEAVEELKHWYIATARIGSILHRLVELDFCQTYPEASLMYLDSLVPAQLQWRPAELLTAVNQIANASPGITQDVRYVRLLELSE